MSFVPLVSVLNRSDFTCKIDWVVLQNLCTLFTQCTAGNTAYLLFFACALQVLQGFYFLTYINQRKAVKILLNFDSSSREQSHQIDLLSKGKTWSKLFSKPVYRTFQYKWTLKFKSQLIFMFYTAINPNNYCMVTNIGPLT